MSENSRFWIAFGDVHQSASMASFIPDIEKAEAVIITGDLTNHSPAGAVEKVWDTVSAANPNILAQRGNMDRDNVTLFIQGKNANLHCEVYELAPGVKLMGVGCSIFTPFGTPGEVSEEQLAQWLDETYARIGDYEHLVLAVHDAPKDSRLDVLTNGMHVGSASVRAFIEKVQPEVVVCGHIHEAAGEDFIGNSKMINPGMLSGGGYVRISLADGKIEANLERVSG